MTLEARKEKILAAIVKHYVSTGEPVGSKTLLNSLDFTVSSATVRNEMAHLSEQGFLEQPHTSAGRIPSAAGYRYYIDHLMQPIILNPREERIIQDTLKNSSDDPEHILSQASKILSQLTGYVAISTTPSAESTTISKIRLVQTGRHTAMMVMITSTGMIKNRLFHCDFNINEEMLAVYETALNEMLQGVLLSSVSPAFLQTLAVSLGELMSIMPQVLLAVMDAAKEASIMSLSLHGQTNLLLIQDFDLLAVRGIMRFLSQKESIEKLLFGISGKSTIMLGVETKILEISQTGLVVSRYSIDDRDGGYLAVMGPTRMDYASSLAKTQFVSSYVGTLISNLVDN